MNNARQRILIIRLSSIGDILHCSALPRHLRQRFPEAEIHWVVRDDNKELIQYNPFLSKVIAFDRRRGLKGWLELSRNLQKENYTHVYDAHNKLRSRILCWYLKPSFFIRRSKDRFKRLLLFCFKIDRFGPSYRAVDSYIEPLRPWGIVNDHQGPELHLPPETVEKVKSLLPKTSASLLALAPATAWPKKTWPVEYWKKLVGLLLKKSNHMIVILAGPHDDFCRELITDSQRVISLQGRLTLLESAAAVLFCKNLVAADTGLLHMAESLQKNVVGLLGPTHAGHPYRRQSIGLKTKLWCQPCSSDGSGPCYNPTYQKCLKLITPEMVLDAVERVAEKS